MQRDLPSLGLLGVRELQGHPVAGSSWKGFVIEQVAAALPAGAHMGFYRTTVGAEIELVIEHWGRKVGIEVKFSGAWVVAPVTRRYPLAPGADVIPVHGLGKVLAALDA